MFWNMTYYSSARAGEARYSDHHRAAWPSLEREISSNSVRSNSTAECRSPRLICAIGHRRARHESCAPSISNSTAECRSSSLQRMYSSFRACELFKTSCALYRQLMRVGVFLRSSVYARYGGQAQGRCILEVSRADAISQLPLKLPFQRETWGRGVHY
jgi:hypothetical protein